MSIPHKPLHEQAIALARAVHATARTGDVAELRRLRPESAPGFAFWRILVAADLTPPDAQLGDFIAAVCLMAMAHGRHAPGSRLGRALADAGVDERRVLMLLRAEGPALFDQARSIAHLLDTKTVVFDHAELAQLILAREADTAERIRRRIASDFFRASHAASAAPSTDSPST